MGTRADFWLGTDPKTMKWMGSIAWDGYPEGIELAALEAEDRQSYQKAVNDMLFARDDATYPGDGWPWPWKDSRMTDYAYAFDRGRVLCSHFGSPWQIAMEFETDTGDDEDHDRVEFPDMTDVQRVALGARSGLIVVQKHTDGSIEIV